MTYAEAVRIGMFKRLNLETEILVRQAIIKEQMEKIQALGAALEEHNHSENVRECRARSTMVGS